MKKIGRIVGITLLVLVVVFIALTVAEYYAFDKAANSAPKQVEVRKKRNS